MRGLFLAICASAEVAFETFLSAVDEHIKHTAGQVAQLGPVGAFFVVAAINGATPIDLLDFERAIISFLETVAAAVAIAVTLPLDLILAALAAGFLLAFSVWVLIWAPAPRPVTVNPALPQPIAAPTVGPTINPLRSHQNDLPTAGDHPYIPPKGVGGDISKAWDNAGKGFRDAGGNIWTWAPPGAMHGGAHWDVEHADGSHTNVGLNGNVIGGPRKDNFPNKGTSKNP
jgi:hypothetical protein